MYTIQMSNNEEVKIGRADVDKSLLHVVYEDDDVVVINKPEGLCTIAVPGHPEIPTAYHMVDQYVKEKGRKKSRIWIVHRLDRDTSGLLMFAKNAHSQMILRHNWDEIVEDRRYVAVTEGVLTPQQGQYASNLFENPVTKRMYSANRPGGKWAVTNFYVIRSNAHYSLVELELETGRKNQIRVHLSEHGCPIIGDSKYGARYNPIGRMGLHAFCLTFHHPRTGELIDLQTPVPESFTRLVQ